MRAIPAGNLTSMVGKYICEKIGMTLDEGMYTAFIVQNDDGDFVAGVVISNFRGTDCEISCAAETPAAWRPHVCKAIFSYIFEQLGCVRCTSITTKFNKKARKFLESLGFVLEGNLRLGYDGTVDALIYGLLAKECRFLKELEADGQEKRAEAAGGTGPSSDGAGAGSGEQGSRNIASVS